MTVGSLPLRKLLLGQLSPDETALLEEKIFLEDGVAESLREEELDLFDDYVKGRLSPVDRAAMELHVLMKDHSVDLGIARALAAPVRTGDAMTPRPAPRQWRVSRLLLPAATLIAAGLAALWMLPSGFIGLGHPAGGGLGVAVGPTHVAASERTVVLLMDRDRGGAPAALPDVGDGTTIRLQAEVPESTQDVTYSLDVAERDGRSLYRATRLTSRVTGPYHFVEVRVPVQALGPGDRAITLRNDSAGESAEPVFSWQTHMPLAGSTQK